MTYRATEYLIDQLARRLERSHEIGLHLSPPSYVTYAPISAIFWVYRNKVGLGTVIVLPTERITFSTSSPDII